jgi:cathepsin X
VCVSDQVRDHQCYKCNWDGTCAYQAESSGSGVNLYGAQSFGSVIGEQQMMAEIAQRGPIACLINSDPPAFDQYTSGIITCPPSIPACQGGSDHYVVIAGYGVDAATGLKYWIGRNSYGTNWGANGWFKIQRGTGTLNIDTDTCAWAVPNATDVARVLAEFKRSL